ncbi:hypothetical protein LMG19282_01488 [Cupriavidus campinensis]|uniref:CopG-like ribbon-helix-helix domain-containing protein n=1 Tax=Cupriavidus campinensis TaxID=151783 RepID=A0ABY3EJ81_9BURK|nr:hypothetical protein [Cupriavidus campinensis]TSP10986.1 hypothetical protein FGG12_19170 [Cupriavidus campinensis]CAG2138384.1 hypothetical protein LMG19282_01488 [Cupriavidus campinensis]
MNEAKEQKHPVLIRLPLPIVDWLFSESIQMTEKQRVQISVPALIVTLLLDQGDVAGEDFSERAALPGEKKSVLVRVPVSLHESLFSESVEVAKQRRVRTSVPSLVVEKLTRLYLQGHTQDQPGAVG